MRSFGGPVGTPRAWDPEVIDQAIPELPKTVPNGSGGGSTAEPPVELTPEALNGEEGGKGPLERRGRSG